MLRLMIVCVYDQIKLFIPSLSLKLRSKKLQNLLSFNTRIKFKSYLI